MAFGFSLSHKTKDIKRDWNALTRTGQGTFDSGEALTNQEIGTLRGYSDIYRERLKDPLGEVGRGIFTRARGALSDAATQRAGSFSSRIFQQALQGGANLSPEARAQLTEMNQRDINQELFKGNVAISDAEAQLTLKETSNLFDRMENISKTILGAGEARANRGLTALIQSLLGRQSLALGKVAAATQMVGTAASAGVAAGTAGKGGSPNPYTGG